MKLLQAIFVIGLLGMLCADLAINIETNKMIRSAGEAEQSTEPNGVDKNILQGLNQTYLSGIQQRTVLMQRLLGLEHVHGLHKAGQPIKMCPLCNTPQPQPSPNRDLVTKGGKEERIFWKQ